ncbi:hypothetical protein GUJ93_ZPchr0008g13245 [Zizania palustris]|uniref:Uncharacterized protein n=1 Tax=Zizania palustris TaxID=103762 RepID=A0A8J5RWE1_ZIZPA|nr:hypothetical protein GUJ93_ZPchr0008g13245 [Zizania palustris]
MVAAEHNDPVDTQEVVVGGRQPRAGMRPVTGIHVSAGRRPKAPDLKALKADDRDPCRRGAKDGSGDPRRRRPKTF